MLVWDGGSLSCVGEMGMQEHQLTEILSNHLSKEKDKNIKRRENKFEGNLKSDKDCREDWSIES